MNTLNQVSAQAALPNLQRIQVLVEQEHIKICLERFAHHLGWYIAGSLMVPADQLSVLQQTLQRISENQTDNNAPPSNIIPLSSFLTSFSA
jgi:hypothetical protein